jgi:hypothetical protein
VALAEAAEAELLVAQMAVLQEDWGDLALAEAEAELADLHRNLDLVVE